MGYSQFCEEELVLDWFKQNRPLDAIRLSGPGRFLDIGAHDGVSCSNTRRLAETGWSGALVEPSPVAFAKLMKVYGGRKDIQLVNVGIVPGDNMRLLRFYETGGTFVGTFDLTHRDEWEGKQNVHFQPIYVVGTTFDALFSVLPGPYQFISIDVEGTNAAVFESLVKGGRLDALETQLVCVEHQGQTAKLAHLAGPAFEMYRITEANILLGRRQ